MHNSLFINNEYRGKMYRVIVELEKMEREKLHRPLRDRDISVKAKCRKRAVWKIAKKFGVKRWKIWNWDSPYYTIEEMAQILIDNKLSLSLDDTLNDVKFHIDQSMCRLRRYWSDPYGPLLVYEPDGPLTYPSGLFKDSRSGFEIYEDDEKDSPRKYKLKYYYAGFKGHPI